MAIRAAAIRVVVPEHRIPRRRLVRRGTRALLRAVQAILMQPYNLKLLADLKEQGLLPASVELPAWPTAPQPGLASRTPGPEAPRHVPFTTVALPDRR